jgi:hypothetical protein
MPTEQTPAAPETIYHDRIPCIGKSGDVIGYWDMPGTWREVIHKGNTFHVKVGSVLSDADE